MRPQSRVRKFKLNRGRRKTQMTTTDGAQDSNGARVVPGVKDNIGTELTPQKASEANAALQARIKRERDQAADDETFRHMAEAENLIERVRESDRDWAAYRQICLESAIRFLDECSLEPTPDAAEQLAG